MNTARSAWPDAKAVAAAWETAGSWGSRVKWVEPPPAVAPPADPSTISRRCIADAIRAYLAIREGAGVAPATLRNYRTFTKQLREFADARGYAMLDQFTSADIDAFYGGSKLGARSKGKRLGTLRGFSDSV